MVVWHQGCVSLRPALGPGELAEHTAGCVWGHRGAALGLTLSLTLPLPTAPHFASWQPKTKPLCSTAPSPATLHSGARGPQTAPKPLLL